MAVHAAVDYSLAWPLETKAAPTVVVLAIRDELRLLALVDDLENCGLKIVKFYEPDLGGELASISSIDAGPALHHLPLLFHNGGR